MCRRWSHLSCAAETSQSMLCNVDERPLPWSSWCWHRQKPSPGRSLLDWHPLWEDSLASQTNQPPCLPFLHTHQNNQTDDDIGDRVGLFTQKNPLTSLLRLKSCSIHSTSSLVSPIQLSSIPHSIRTDSSNEWIAMSTGESTYVSGFWKYTRL